MEHGEILDGPGKKSTSPKIVLFFEITTPHIKKEVSIFLEEIKSPSRVRWKYQASSPVVFAWREAAEERLGQVVGAKGRRIEGEMVIECIDVVGQNTQPGARRVIGVVSRWREPPFCTCLPGVKA